MLRSLKELERCVVEATDGGIGSVQDFYFDDESWVVRYLVVDTGEWLAGRKVLISPHSIGGLAADGKSLSASISREQVKNSPAIDPDKPGSRARERGYFAYYGYPYYWDGAGLWGENAHPGMTVGGVAYADPASEIEAEREQHVNPHLRSCNAVARYYLHASDGEIGHVQGYLIDDKSWAIRFLIVNTSNWWLGHQVLIAPQWIEDVSWLDSTVTTDLTRQAVKHSPAYDPEALPDAGAERALFQHYGRSEYQKTRTKR